MKHPEAIRKLAAVNVAQMFARLRAHLSLYADDEPEVLARLSGREIEEHAVSYLMTKFGESK